MLEPVWTESTKAKKESEGKCRKANLEVCHLNNHQRLIENYFAPSELNDLRLTLTWGVAPGYRLGRRYLLFLKAIPNTDDFEIVTGYELSPSNSVVAVDEPNQFREQNGRDVGAFLEAVKTAVRQKRSNQE